MNRPRHWPDASATNTPSSASSAEFDPAMASWGFNLAAEIARAEARINHPSTRADLLARVLPFADEFEVGTTSADRRRHDDRSRPTAAAVGAASSTPAGARRGLIALACCFVVGVWIGRRR